MSAIKHHSSPSCVANGTAHQYSSTNTLSWTSKRYANMIPADEETLLAIFNVIRIVLLPCAWLESLCLHVLNVDIATPFRMFPAHDPHPEYPASECNFLALVMMLFIPCLVASEARPNCIAPLGRLLRPLTRRCSRFGAWVLMFLRLWLYMACFNYQMTEILRDPFRIVIHCIKIKCLIFLL